MGQSVCKCCNCTSSADAHKRHSSKIYPQKPLKVDCVWTQGSSLPSSIYRHHTSLRSSHDSDFHSLGTSMGEDSSLKKSGEDLASGEITTEIFNGGDLSELPVFLKKLKDITVKVGTSTRITVEIICSTDFVVSWYRNDNQILANDDYKIIHEGTLYAIEFTCLNVQDNGRWTCSAESNKGRITSSCYLKVNVPKSYKKPVFYEELEAVLTDEGTVSLQCKVVGVPTPLLRWFKDGREIKAGDIFALVANSRDPVNLGVYTCEASNCMGKAYSSSRVKVNSKLSLSPRVQEVISVAPSGQPPIFIQDLKDENVKVGESFILSCQIAVPPWPKSIKWQNPQEQFVDVSEERYRDLADGLGGYMLEIVSSEECDRGIWKCVAISGDNSVAVSSCNIQIWVPKTYRKPYFVEKLKAVLTEDGLVSFECKVVGYPTPYLRWFKDGSELKAGDIYQLTGISSLGFYVCIAKNCMGEAKSEAELTVDDIKQQLTHEETLMLSTIRQPPKFLKKLMSCEASINSAFKFTVQVKTPPTSKLLWYRDDHMVEINDKKYSQKVESMGISHLNISKLEFEDQAEWKCVASNEFGRSECSSFLKLIIPKHYKKPKFLENLRAILTENGVVNLECKVIGVPQPTLIWYKDGVELNPGDIHKIMSGQDGTCCLGVYTCEARNCMGSVTSSASVHGIEDATPIVKPKIRRLSLSTINEEDTFKTADDEQSLINDQPHEISYSFDGKEISVSYYDTPDITQEEAIQIIEMYADQLSEHISEHNVLELPPLRIVKETSTASNILMEGVVIDIQPEYFTVEEDLRTEAGIEDISVIEDTLFSSKTSKFSTFEAESSKNTREKYSDIKSTSDSTIQSPELYYSLSESKRDHSSLPISPRSRQSMELETESYISAKSYETTEKNAKKYLQDSPDRSISITEANYISPKLEDVTDDSVLRHNTQFITVLLTNNLTDIQQRLCYMEKEMYLKSLKQQPKITDGIFKDTSGLIQSIQKLREFFLNFKQKKNGNSINVTFLDLCNIVQKLQTNICNIHTNVMNDLNETSQKNSIQIVYQIGETLVNVLDLIGDILKLDTFELCRSNVTQSEKQRLFNLILDTRNKLNELVIGTHNLFVDIQDNVETSKHLTHERETFEQKEEVLTTASRETKDEQKREIIEKQLVELEIGKDKHKEEIMEEIFTYQEDKINDILFDLDLVKPLFATLSELRVSDINYSEIFENNTVKKLLFSIFEIEKEIIHSELQQIRLIELDETDYSRITQYEANKIALKFKLSKINEQQNILSRMPNILKMDQYSKDIIQNILSLEWLEDKENELKEYLATVIRRRASLSLKTSQHLVREIEIDEDVIKKEQSTQETRRSEQKIEDTTKHIESDVKEEPSITEITPENILSVLATTELDLNPHEKYMFIKKLKYYLVNISQEEIEIIENYVLDNQDKLDFDDELKDYAAEIVTQLNEIKYKNSKSPSKMIEKELFEMELFKIQVTQLASRKFHEIKDQMPESLNIIPNIIKNILKTVEEQKQFIINSLILRRDTQTVQMQQDIGEDKKVSEVEYEYLSKTQKEIVEQRARDSINLKEYFLQMSEEQKLELVKELISHYNDKNYYEYLKIEEDQLLTELKNKITQKLRIENAKQTISEKDNKLIILDGEISEFKNVLCATQIKKLTVEKILESNIQKEHLQDIGLNLIFDVILEKSEHEKIIKKLEDTRATAKTDSVQEQILEKSEESKIITTTEKVDTIEEQILEKPEELKITDKAEEKYEITTTEKVASIPEQILGKVEESKLIQEAEEKYESTASEKIVNIPEQISEKHEELKITKEAEEKHESTVTEKVASIPEQIQEKLEELKITKEAGEKYESISTEEVVSLPEQIQEKSEELKITKEAGEKYESIATEKVASLPEQIQEKSEELKITKGAEQKVESMAIEKVASIPEQILEKSEELKITKEAEEKYEDITTEKVASIPVQILDEPEKLKITKEAEEKYESTVTEKVASIPEQIQKKAEELKITKKAREKYESIATEELVSLPEQILEKSEELKIAKEAGEKYESIATEKLASLPEQIQEKSEELKITKGAEEKVESMAIEKVASIPEQILEKSGELKITKEAEEKYDSITTEKVASIPVQILDEPEKLKITKEAEEKYESTVTEKVASIPEQIQKKAEELKITKEAREKYESIATEEVVSLPEQILEKSEELKITKEAEEKVESIATERVASLSEQIQEKSEELKITKGTEEKVESIAIEKVATIPEQILEKSEELKITKEAEEKYEGITTEKVASIPEQIPEEPEELKITKEAEGKYESTATEKVAGIPEQTLDKPEELKIIKEAEKTLETSAILKVDSVPEQMLEMSKQVKVVRKAEEVTESDQFDETCSLQKELVTIEKLKQYLEIIPEFQKVELIKEVALKCQDMNYIDELIQNEQNLKSKIEKLESVTFSKDTETETKAQGITVQTEEKELLEPNLIQTQIKILALGKLTEMFDETKQVEDLVKNTLLCLPNVLTEKENLVKAKVNKNDIQTWSSPIENIIDEAKQKIKEKLIEKDDTTKTQELHNVIKLKEHVASILETDKDELLKELCSNYKNENFMNLLTLEEEKLQDQLKTIETELQTLGSISTLAFEQISQVPEKKNNLEQVSVLKEKQTNVETSLLKTQIKVLALAKVSEISDDNLEAEIKFENILINLPEILNEKEITITENIKDSLSQVKQIKDTVIQDKNIIGQEKLSKQTIKLVENTEIMKQQELVNIKKLKQYAATVSEVDKAEILQDLLINYSEENALSKLVSEEELLNAQINRLELLNEGVIFEVPLEETSDKLITQPSSEKVHISEQEKLQLEQNLFKTQIKKLVIEQINEKSEQSNPESLLKDTLSHISDILEEKEKTVSSTVNKEEISAETERKIDIPILQKPPTEIISEKITYEQEDEPTATATVQKYLTSISESDKMDIVKDLSVNWKNEDFVKALITEEAKLKEEIKEIKVEKLHLHSVSEIPLEKIKEIPLTHYDNANILEEKLSSLESQLSQVQVKMMAIAKVSQTDDSSENVEDLFMDALTLPTVLEEKGYITNKSEMTERKIDIPLLEKPPTEIISQKITYEQEDEPTATATVQKYLTSISESDKMDIVKDLTVNWKNEDFVKALITEEAKLKEEIKEIKVEKLHLHSVSEIPLEKIEQIPVAHYDKANILEEKLSSLELQLSQVKVKMMAIAKVSQIDDSSENVEDLFMDALTLPTVLEEKGYITNKSEMTERKIDTTLLQKPPTEIISEKITSEQEDEPTATTTVQKYLTCISESDKMDIVKDLTVNWKNEDFVKALITEEAKLKEEIKEIKVEKLHLHSVSEIPLDKIQEIPLTHYDNANILEEKLSSLESQLSQVQVKMMAIAKVSQIDDSSENVEDLFMDALTLPTVLKEKGYITNKSEVKETPITLDLDSKLQTKEIFKQKFDNEKIKEHCNSLSEVQVSEMINQLSLNYGQENYVKTLEAEKVQLINEINETELQKAHLESIKETVTNKKVKNNIEQISILQQKQESLESQLMDNCIKNLALDIISHTAHQTEVNEKLFENAILAIPKLLDAKKDIIGEEQTSLPKGLIENIHNKKEHLKEINELKEYVTSISSENKTNLIKELITECKFEQPEYRLVEIETELKTKLKAISQNEPIDNTIEQKQILESQLKNVQIKKLVLEKIQEHQQPLESLEILFENILLQLPTVFERMECSIDASLSEDLKMAEISEAKVYQDLIKLAPDVAEDSQRYASEAQITTENIEEVLPSDQIVKDIQSEQAKIEKAMELENKIQLGKIVTTTELGIKETVATLDTKNISAESANISEVEQMENKINIDQIEIVNDKMQKEIDESQLNITYATCSNIMEEEIVDELFNQMKETDQSVIATLLESKEKQLTDELNKVKAVRILTNENIQQITIETTDTLPSEDIIQKQQQVTELQEKEDVLEKNVLSLKIQQLALAKLENIEVGDTCDLKQDIQHAVASILEEQHVKDVVTVHESVKTIEKAPEVKEIRSEEVVPEKTETSSSSLIKKDEKQISEEVNISKTEVSTIEHKPEKSEVDKIEEIKSKEEKPEIEKIEKVEVKEEASEMEKIEKVEVKEEKSVVDKTAKVEVKEEKSEIDKIEKAKKKEDKSEVDKTAKEEIKEEKPETEKLDKEKDEKSEVHKTAKIEVKEEKPEIEKIGKVEVKEEEQEIEKIEKAEVKEEKSEIDKIEKAEKKEDKSKTDKTAKVEKKEEKSEVDKTAKVEVKEEIPEIDKIEKAKKKEDKSEVDKTAKKETKEEIKEEKPETEKFNKEKAQSEKSEIEEVKKMKEKEEKSVDTTSKVEVKEEKSEIDKIEKAKKKEDKSEVDKSAKEEITEEKTETEKLDKEMAQDEKSEIEKGKKIKEKKEKSEVDKTAKVEIKEEKPETEKLDKEKAQGEKSEIQKVKKIKEKEEKLEVDKIAKVEVKEEKSEIDKIEELKKKEEKSEVDKTTKEEIKEEKQEIEKLDKEKAQNEKSEIKKDKKIKEKKEKSEVDKTATVEVTEEKSEIDKTEKAKKKEDKSEVDKTAKVERKEEKPKTEKIEKVEIKGEKSEIDKIEKAKKKEDKSEVDKTIKVGVKEEKSEIKKVKKAEEKEEKSEIDKTAKVKEDNQKTEMQSITKEKEKLNIQPLTLLEHNIMSQDITAETAQELISIHSKDEQTYANEFNVMDEKVQCEIVSKPQLLCLSLQSPLEFETAEVKDVQLTELNLKQNEDYKLNITVQEKEHVNIAFDNVLEQATVFETEQINSEQTNVTYEDKEIFSANIIGIEIKENIEKLDVAEKLSSETEISKGIHKDMKLEEENKESEKLEKVEKKRQENEEFNKETEVSSKSQDKQEKTTISEKQEIKDDEQVKVKTEKKEKHKKIKEEEKESRKVGTKEEKNDKDTIPRDQKDITKTETTKKEDKKTDILEIKDAKETTKTEKSLVTKVKGDIQKDEHIIVAEEIKENQTETKLVKETDKEETRAREKEIEKKDIVDKTSKPKAEEKEETKIKEREDIKEKEAVIEVKEKDKKRKEETEKKDSIKELRKDDAIIESKAQTQTKGGEDIKEKEAIIEVKEKDKRRKEETEKKDSIKEVQKDDAIIESKEDQTKKETEEKEKTDVKKIKRQKSKGETIKDQSSKTKTQDTESKEVKDEKEKVEKIEEKIESNIKEVDKEKLQIKIKDEDKKEEKQVAKDKQVQEQRRKSEDKKDEKQVAEDKQVQKQRRKSEDKNNKNKIQSKDKEDNIETKAKEKEIKEDKVEKKEIEKKDSSRDKEDNIETKAKEKEIVIERKTTEDKTEKKEIVEKESSIKEIKEKDKDKDKREKSKEKQFKERKRESEKPDDKKTRHEENLKNGKKFKTQEEKEIKKEKIRKSPSIELSTQILKSDENKIDSTEDIKLQYTTNAKITKEQTYEINEEKHKRIDLKLKEENKEEKEKYKMTQQKISDRKEETKESRIEKYEEINKERTRERKEIIAAEKQKIEIRKSKLDETDKIDRLLQRSKEQRLEKLPTKEMIKSNYLLRDEQEKEKEKDARNNRLKNLVEPSEINVYKEMRKATRDTRHIDSYSKSLDVLKQDKYSTLSTSLLPTYRRKYSDSMSSHISVPESMRVSTRKSYVTKNYPYSNIDNFLHIRDDIKETHGRIQNLLKSSKEITNSLSAMSSRHERLQKYEYEPLVQKSMQISSYSTYNPYQWSRSLYRNRSTNMFNTCMDYHDYYKHYFKLPIAYAVYKSNLDRSHLYPRRYEITLYYGLLRRQHTIVRGYKSLEYGTAISKVIKREALEQMDVSAIKFNCTDSCHAYNKECPHKPNITSLITKGKLVLGHKGFVDARPIMSQKRSVVWEAPDYEKYARDKQTESIVTKDRADFAFVQVTPRKPLMDQKTSTATTFMSAPVHETVEKSHSSHLPHSFKSQKTTTIFISRPDSLISVAPGQDIIISFKINEDSSTKIYLTKRFADVTKNPRFRSEKYGNLIRFTLTNANYEDMGTYCLTVENNYNSSRSYITVTVDSNMRNTTYYKLSRNQMLPPIIRNTTIPTRSKLSQDISLSSLASYRRSCSPSPSYSVSPPIFYTLPHNIVTEPGETVRFQITIGGFPSPSVTWLKNGILILSSGKIRIIEKFNTKILEIACVSFDDAGTYTVIISNEAGRALSTAKLDLIQLRNRPYLLRLRY